MMAMMTNSVSKRTNYEKGEYNMTVAGLMIVMLMGGAQVALAHGDVHHAMGGDMHNPCSMGMSMDKGEMKGGFLTTKEIDGYKVSFHIMKAPAGMAQGGTHHVMIKVAQDGKAITDLVANSKVVHPNGKSESKMLMKMGDWYMASYDLGHPGKHQVMALFKTNDGGKHFGGVDYMDDGTVAGE